MLSPPNEGTHLQTKNHHLTSSPPPQAESKPLEPCCQKRTTSWIHAIRLRLTPFAFPASLPTSWGSTRNLSVHHVLTTNCRLGELFRSGGLLPWRYFVTQWLVGWFFVFILMVFCKGWENEEGQVDFWYLCHLFWPQRYCVEKVKWRTGRMDDLFVISANILL